MLLSAFLSIKNIYKPFLAILLAIVLLSFYPSVPTAQGSGSVSLEYINGRIVLMGSSMQVDSASIYIEDYLQDIDPNVRLSQVEQVVLDWIPAGEWICDPNANNVVINQYSIDLPESSDIVIDNTDSDKLTVIGDWRTSDAIQGSIGGNYIEDRNSDKGNKKVIFTPRLGRGIYEIYLNWTTHSNRANNAPVYVNHANGSDLIVIDQTKTIDEPYLLGTYEFNGDTSESVEIRNDDTNGHVIADAVIFRKADWVEEILAATASSTFTDMFVNVHTEPNYQVTDSGWIYAVNNAGVSNISAHASAFWKQWSLQELDLSTGAARSSTISFTGSGITVGIFDASPYNGDGRINFNNAPLNFDIDTIAYEISESDVITAGGQNHGLAVASLVHAVAPEADIQLHRILTTKTKGDLFSLIKALNNFIENTDGPAIINLSLGVPTSLQGSPGLSCEDDVPSLKTVLYSAHKKGIATVAASGNVGSDIPQIPAIWDWVIDVSATQPGYDLAEYSNYGGVAAPGGSKVDCRVEPELCVVGASNAYDTGFAYWTGTSFAAPLVSGLAALYLEHSPDLTPDEVANQIRQSVAPNTSGSGRGAGVIQISCDNQSRVLLEPDACESLTISADDFIVNQNMTVTVPISVSNILVSTPLGAATIKVTYDPTVVSVLDCIENPGDIFDLGFCNTNTPGEVIFNIGSSNGSSLDSALANIVFHAIGNVGDTTPITIEIENFVDTQGQLLSHIIQIGEITIIEANVLLGDVTCDGQVDILDAMYVLQYDVDLRQGTDQCPLSDPTGMMYLPACDVNHDNQCDSTDGLFIMQCTVGINNVFCPAVRSASMSPSSHGENSVTKATLTTFQVSANTQTAPVEETVIIPITASVTDGLLGATTIEVHYDPSVLAPTDCNTNPNRDFNAVTCNETYESNGVNPDVVRFSAVSAVGVAGEALGIVDLIFDVIGEAGSNTNLDIEIVTAGEPTGAAITDTSGQDGAVMVTAVPGSGELGITKLFMSDIRR